MANRNNNGNATTSASGQSVTQINQAEIATARKLYDLGCVAASCVNDGILPTIEALKALAKFDSEDIGLLRSRLSLIRDLASVGTMLAYDAAGDLEEQRDAFKDKMNELMGAAA